MDVPDSLVAVVVVAMVVVAMAVEDDRHHMVDVSLHADAVLCVKIMAEVVDAFNAPIHVDVRDPACYPDRQCATPDHPGGKHDNVDCKN